MMGTGKQLHNSVVKGPYFCYFRAGEGGGGGGEQICQIYIN